MFTRYRPCSSKKRKQMLERQLGRCNDHSLARVVERTIGTMDEHRREADEARGLQDHIAEASKRRQ
jgi:hypothetical protein